MSQPIANVPSGSSHFGRTHVRVRDLATAGAYVALYVLLDRLSYVQPVLKLGITPWNPQAGLTLALLLMRGTPWAPATALAAFLSEDLVRDRPAAGWLLLAASAWIACGYAVLAGILRRWGLPRPIDSAALAARLSAGSLVTTVTVALGYVLMFVGVGVLPADAALTSVARYCVGDLNGILTLTPLILYADQWQAGREALRRHWRLVVAQFAAVVFAMWIAFGLTATDQLRFFYPLFVPVIWITLRWGVPGAVLSTLTIQIGLIIGAQDEANAPPLIDLQFLLLTLSLTALLLGSVVTERAEALKRVAMREAEQRTLLATAPDAVLTIDISGRIQSANPAALRLFGNDTVAQTGRELRELLPGIQLHSQEGRATLEGRRAHGATFPAEISWAHLEAPANGHHLVIIRDATEQRRAQVQLREREAALARAMRFAVAGELASALTHELNQPITALVSYLRASEILAAPLASQDERLPGTLSKAAHEAIRASEVLRRLRDFYRGGAIKLEPVHLSSLCNTLVASFQERIRANGVELSLNLPKTLPCVETGATQLAMVLHNLLSNAIDAVSQQLPESRCIEVSAEAVADGITLRVEDSGAGLASDVREKLFEPFVTSKVDGMGLGLVISRSLLRAQGGDLTHESPGRFGGARFIVRLPLHPPDEVDV